MERLSHDLARALEESAGGGGGQRAPPAPALAPPVPRRRTRSAGSLPAAYVTSVIEDGSSSSPPQAPIVTQPLSDSDEPHKPGAPRLFCPGGNFESDSLNENLSPTRPANARRKRKYKKMAVDCVEPGRPPSPLHLLAVPQSLTMPLPYHQGSFPTSQINKKKRIHKQDHRGAWCGKRKWSGRGDAGEMRERSFSGGCTSKSYFFNKSYSDFKNGKKYTDIKLPKYKEMLLNPSKQPATELDTEHPAAPALPLPAAPALPGSSSFNFVYKKNGTSFTKMRGFRITTDLPPVFCSAAHTQTSVGTLHTHARHHGKSKHRRPVQQVAGAVGLRDPLLFERIGAERGEAAGVADMECGEGGAGGAESSSLSSSDSDGVVTNESDREGDDELTDWPGSDEITLFNKSLSLNNKQRQQTTTTTRHNKKDKFLPKYGLSSCKNRSKQPLEQDNGLQVMEEDGGGGAGDGGGGQVYTSFSEVREAGVAGLTADHAFYHSFQAYADTTPRTNFALEKTSSSDLGGASGGGGAGEVREIRAGCRRIREERPGSLILSAVNEQLSRFLQDSRMCELRLDAGAAGQVAGAAGQGTGDGELSKLRALAQLYSLDLLTERNRPLLLRKTPNTTQAIRVEHGRLHHARTPHVDYKRRCYGDDTALPAAPHAPLAASLIGEALIDPGDID